MFTKNKGSCELSICLVIGLLLGLMPVFRGAGAAETNWQVGPAPDNWFLGGNWDNGLPDNATNAIIDNGGTAQIILNNNAHAFNVLVGETGGNSGKIVQNTGTLTVWGPWLDLGLNLNASGTYELSGNGQVTAPEIRVGDLGTGVFTQSGGSVNTGVGSLYLSRSSAQASGTYTLSNGTLSTSNTYVGQEGSASFTHSGGTHTVTNTLYINDDADNRTVTYTLSGAAQLSANTIELAGVPTGTGNLTQTGGTLNVTNNLVLSAAGDATFKISDGTCTVGGSVVDAAPPTTKIIVDGGTFTVNGTDIQADTFTLAEALGSNGSFTLSGGQFLVTEDTLVGRDGSGTLTQNNGTNNCEYLYLGYSTDGDGTYDLQNGTVTVSNKQYVGRRGNGSFNQSGGICDIHGSLYVGRYSTADNSSFTLTNGDLDVGDTEYVGYSGTGSFNQSGGTHDIVNNLYVGYSSTGNGTYTLSGTGTLSVPTLHVGSDTGGTGQFKYYLGATLDADTINVKANGSIMRVERPWSYDGELNITDGQVELVDNMSTYYHLTLDAPGAGASCTMAGWPRLETGGTTIGENGKGTFTHNGGPHNVHGSLKLGQGVGSEGIYNFSDGNLFVEQNERVGFSGTGSVVHTGGMHQITGSLYLGSLLGSTGTYQLSQADPNTPSDVHAQNQYIGDLGTGTFTQSGGCNGAESLYLGHQGGSTGTYTISGGMLHANDFYIGTGGDGTFHITDSAADVYVGNGLHFGANATFTAVAGATINMIGSTLTNESTDPTATGLAGLENVNLIFQGGTDDVDPVEVAGEDKGLVAGGWVENFALDTLTLGAGFEMTEGRIRLVDDFDNQPGWVGSEALYVDTLVLNAGATIDPNNLNLYYLNGGAAKKFYLGDANLDGKVNVGDLGILAANYGQNEKVWAQADFNGDALVNVGDLGILAANYGSGEGGGMVPEPATLVLLVIGALPLTRRRR